MIYAINISFAVMLLVTALYTKYRRSMIISLIFVIYYGAFFIAAPNMAEDYEFQLYMKQFALILLFNVGFIIASFSVLPLVLSGPIRVAEDGYDAISLARIRNAAFIFFIICAVITIVYFSVVGVPWASSEIESARHANKGSGYISMFWNRGIPISSLLFIAANMRSDSKLFTMNNIIIMAIALFCMLLGAFRTYAILYIMTIFVFWTISQGRVYYVRMGLILAIAIAIYAVITIAKFGDDDPIEILVASLRHRVIFEQIWTIGYAIRLFDIGGAWWGKTYLMDINSALPGPGMSYGDYLVYFVDPYSSIAGVAALTPSIIGESYVNFGWIGVLIAGLIHPILFFILVTYCGRDKIMGGAFISIFGLYLTQTVEVGFGGLIASRVLPSLVMVSMIFIIACFLRKTPRIKGSIRSH